MHDGRIRVLLFDRDEPHRSALRALLERRGHEVVSVSSLDRLLDHVRLGRSPVLLLELDLETDVPLLLGTIRSIDRQIAILCFCSRPSIDGALVAMRNGAFDYLEKPVDAEELGLALREAARSQGLALETLDEVTVRTAERLRARRQELGLTLRQVAARSGLSTSTVSSAERGTAAITVRTLHQLALGLQTPASSLLPEDPGAPMARFDQRLVAIEQSMNRSARQRRGMASRVLGVQ